MMIEQVEKAINKNLNVSYAVRNVMKVAGLPDDAVKQLRTVLSDLKDIHMMLCSYMFTIHVSDLSPWDLRKLPDIKEANDVSDNKELYDGCGGNIIRFRQETNSDDTGK